MIQQNEIITLTCGVGVLIFIWSYRGHLWRVPGSQFLVTAYSLLAVGWVATVLEGLFWAEALNLVEHVCYGASSIALASWFVRLATRREPACQG